MARLSGDVTVGAFPDLSRLFLKKRQALRHLLSKI
ncbi:MAG TPA: ABC transporter ATP-binding protein [Leclercia adecarboxylata]|nr:ABC transporter ATP-binding protein [Leclercia sp. LSNIH3]POW68001.1 ABC transporter ATP-binding protein [Leclercia sp. LSNIH4]QBF89243.1 ABC transporter ATP-binding protein [Leclercia adecarboxylata]QEY57656.1 ABC transporter ATP-binding protein [Leclercia adecarboxylata]QFH52333.1 ABC transporter ATP-binding protein [Leclercia adecarboxylata]